MTDKIKEKLLKEIKNLWNEEGNKSLHERVRLSQRLSQHEETKQWFMKLINEAPIHYATKEQLKRELEDSEVQAMENKK